MKTEQNQKQITIHVEASFYQTLEAIARLERCSVSQIAYQLLEEGLRQRLDGQQQNDDTSGQAIALLATMGGTFYWLAEEPDLYNDRCGEPIREHFSEAENVSGIKQE